jgi:hypothetical protein
MPDTTILLPNGQELRAKDRGASGLDQYVALGAAETWVAYADAVVFAQNKHHLSLLNAAGSGKVVRVKKLFAVNLQTGTITGVVVRFDIKKITAHSSGTSVTPQPMDDNNAALPAGVTARTGATVTEGALLYPWVTQNDEETAVPGFSKAMFQQSVNIIPEGAETQEHVLREGRGLTVKQITSAAVGSYGWLMVFTVE